MFTLIPILVFLTILLWFWAIYDIAYSRFKTPIMSTVWLLVVLFAPLLGSLLYLIFKKKFVYTSPRRFLSDFRRHDKVL